MGFGDIIPWRRRKEGMEGEGYPLTQLQRRMNDIFDDFFSGFEMEPFRGFSERFGGFNPRVNVTETEREIRVTAELPGMSEKDVELSLAGDALILRGEKKVEHEEKGEGGRRTYFERSYGSFQRSIPLSCEIDEDNVDASYRNGVLTIVLPKSKAAQAASKKISIRGS